jgi:acyl CoA:acetate/3-ketoacid CoA transferase alpha subunit
MAMAAKICIVEVDAIVEPGELSPEEIITPFLYVDIIVTREV